ncbi:hypothetical protein DRN52_08335 [Thermococci archaeon]|nr:MAG: hypothetical protein DRN52_08335 [Thermococci archaeon]
MQAEACGTLVMRMDELERTLFIGLPKEIPPSFSWRGQMSKVKNQGNVQSCAAFAATAIIEFQKRKRAEVSQEYDLSEALLYEISTHEDNQTSSSCRQAGRYFSFIINTLILLGIPREDCHPYSKVCEDPPSKFGEESPLWCERWSELSTLNRIKDAVAINTLDLKALKNAIYVAPVLAGMIVFNDFFSYSGGVYEHPPSEGESIAGFHAIVLVGYDDDKKALELRNSWGADWGEEGYAWMSYDLVTAGEYTVTCNGYTIKIPFFFDAYHLLPLKREWSELRRHTVSLPSR